MLEIRSRVRHAVMALLIASVTLVATACGVSRQQEAQIGAQYSAQINQQLPIVEDREVLRYVNFLGDQITRQGDRDFEYTFYVVNADVINAFALPGGYVYLNRGLIEETDNLAELAGVMAHEIGHVEMHHGAEQMERAQKANIGLNLAYILLGRQPSGVEQAAIQVGGSAVFANYGREAEVEADMVAVRLLARTGIDPNGMVTFFKELLEERERQPSRLEQWFSTHPLTEERIANTREAIRQLNLRPGQLEEFRADSRAYEEMKARLNRYPAPPPEFREDSR